MPRIVTLEALLPANRDHPGWIRVSIDGVPVQEFRVLGRGSSTVRGRPTGNPTRNPLLHDGDTPTGDYDSTLQPTKRDQAKYGPWGIIRLKAVAGEALLAEKMGRSGLLIHGGSPGRFDGFRSTLGCLRLHNEDMKKLVQIISGAGDSAQLEMCEAVAIRLSVRERP